VLLTLEENSPLKAWPVLAFVYVSYTTSRRCVFDTRVNLVISLLISSVLRGKKDGGQFRWVGCDHFTRDVNRRQQIRKQG